MYKTNLVPMIRLAKLSDLDTIKEVYKKVVYDINNVKKINMLWNEEYPSCVLDIDIKNKEMYIVEVDNLSIGCFTITTHEDSGYKSVKWTSKDKKSFYLNRLVILPSMQGKGYAKYAIEYIINYARKNKFQVIRLTVHKDNKYAIGLYEKYGFKRIRNTYWTYEDQIYYCYEKYINNIQEYMEVNKR